MQEVDSPHPAGTVGIPIGSLARYTSLFYDLNQLHVPRGTKLRIAEGVNVAYNCNNLVKSMTGDWLWIMGDDHRFNPDILLKLLDRQVDIVVPLVCRRGMPFQTVLYRIAALDRTAMMTFSWADLSRYYPNGGLITLDAAGTAGMLVRKLVFDAIGEQWFEWGHKVSEDIGFCLKARAKGYAICADLDQQLAHTTQCDLIPYRDKDGKWDVAVQVDDRMVSLLNTPHASKDLREITYGRNGLDGLGWEWSGGPQKLERGDKVLN